MRKMLRGSLCAVTLFAFLNLKAENEKTNFIENPGFESVKTDNNKEIPVSWTLGKYSEGKGAFQTDKKIVHSGKSSARLRKENNEGWIQLFQTKRIAPLKRERELKVSVWISCEDAEKGGVVFFGDTSEKKQEQWIPLESFNGTFDWKKIEKTITVKPGIQTLTLSIRLIGKGILWADDCKMKFLEEKNKGNITNPELIQNPAFSGPLSNETGLPDGWLKKRVHGLETVCDYQQTDNSGIELKWKHGGPRFGMEALLSNKIEGENSYEFTASAKTKNGSSAVLIAEALDKAGNIIYEKKSPPLISASWKKATLHFTTPPQTDNLKVFCFNEGQGSVFFKDASLKKSMLAVKKDFPILGECLPVESVKIWSKGNKEFNTFENSPIPIAFHFKGNAKTLKNPSFVIELPAQLDIAECVNTHTSFLSSEKPEIQDIVKNGEKYKKYVFRNPRVFGILQPGFAWERKLTMAFLPKEKGTTGKTFKAYWFIQADDGTKTPEESFNINILPDLQKSKNPKNFPFVCWSTGDINFNNPELLSKIASNYEEAGMNFRQRIGRAGKIDNFLKKRGWIMSIGMPDPMDIKFIKGKDWDNIKHKIEHTLYADGNLKEHGICPQYFITDPDFKKYFDKTLLAQLKERGLKNGETVFLDIEPWAPMEWCFCERCRKDFSEKYKLGKIPTVKDIKNKYQEQWRDFRCENHAEVIRMNSELIKKNFPGSKIFDYDYVVKFNKPNFRDYFYSVGKDPQLNEKYYDGHFSSYYHYVDKDAFDMIDLNVRNLKKDYWVIGAIDKAGTYLNAKEVLSPNQVRMLILASAATGAKGFGIYSGKHIDGKFFVAANKAMAEVAEMEDLFLKGKRIDKEFEVEALPYFTAEITVAGKKKTIKRPNWKDYFGFRAHKFNSEELVSLFNYNNEKAVFATIKTKLPNGNYTVLNPATGKRFLPDSDSESWQAEDIANGIYVKIGPMDAAFALIKKYADSDNKIPVGETNDKLRKEYNEIKASNSSSLFKFKPISKDGLSIAYDDIDGDGSLEITVSSSKQTLWIDADNGGVLSEWIADRKKICRNSSDISKGTQSMFWDYFWLPTTMRRDGSESAKLSVEKIEIKDGRAIISLKNASLKNGLILIKEYSIDNKTTHVNLNYKISNTGKETVEFSFWSHNFPKLSAPGTVFDEMAFILPLKNGVESLHGSKISKFFPVNPVDHPGVKKEALGGQLVSGKFGAFNLKENYGVEVSVDYDQVLMVYIWRSIASTLEWIYKPISLKPESSWETKIELKFQNDLSIEQFEKELTKTK